MILFVLLTFLSSTVGQMQLRGKGASFPSNVYKNWIPAYVRYRSQYVTINMEYDSVGSGNGKQAIKDKVDIEYAGSDSLLSNSDLINYPDLVTFPTMAGAVVLAYNIPSFTSTLNLTRDAITGIYNGTIQWWNDPNIQNTNPNIVLPHYRLTVVARADKSGTTSMFTEALSSFCPEWQSTYGSFSAGKNHTSGYHDYWASDAITYFGETNNGVAGIIMSFDYSIGYLSAADAIETGVSTAYVENTHGEFVQASAEFVQKSMDYYAALTTELTFSLHNAGGLYNYPIAGFTHFIAYKTTMDNCASAKEFVRYTNWVMTDAFQRSICVSQGMAPLSTSMVDRVTSILKEFTCHGKNVWNMVQADIEEENKTENVWLLPVSISISILIVIIMCFSGYIAYQRVSFLRKLYNDHWFIPIEDIVFFYDQRLANSVRYKLNSYKSMFSMQSLQSGNTTTECLDIIKQVLQWPGKWNGNIIGLRLSKIKQISKVTKNMKRKMLIMKDNISHSNVIKFYGLTALDADNYVISEYCGKGQLQDLIQNEKFNLTDQVKLSLAVDVAQGMYYLHSKNYIHGNLKSTKCLIDSKWTVKVCDWEYNTLILSDNEEIHSVLEIRQNETEGQTKYSKHYQDFWTAPEIVRKEYNCKPTTASDVYSYAIILQEIYTREDPYAELSDLMTPEEVVNAVLYMGQIRPKPSDDMQLNVRQCMEIAWSDNPDDRPSFEQILKMIRRSRATNKSVLDSMMETLENYTVLLEEKMDEKVTEMNMTIEQLQNNLSTYIPLSVVQSLQTGQSVDTQELTDVGLVCVDIRKFHKYIESVKNVSSKIKIIDNLFQIFVMTADAFSAYTYSMSLENVIFVLGSSDDSSEKTALKTANMCLKLQTMLKQFVTSMPFTFAITSTIGSIYQRICNTTGRYQIIGSSLDHVILLSRKAKDRSILILLPLCVKIKSCSSFTVSQINDMKDNSQGVYMLEGRHNTIPEIPEEGIEVINLDDQKSSKQSTDVDIDVNCKSDVIVNIST